MHKITYLYEFAAPTATTKEKWVKGIPYVADMLRYDTFFVSHEHPGVLLKAIFSGYRVHGATEGRWESFGLNAPINLKHRLTKEEKQMLDPTQWFTFETDRRGELMPITLAEFKYL